MRPHLSSDERPERLASNVLRARHDLGLSQRALAVAANVTEKTLQSIEAGRTRNPNPRTVEALARALGSTVDALYAAKKPRRKA